MAVRVLWAWRAQFRVPVLGVHLCAAGLRAGALLGAGAAPAVVTVLGCMWRWVCAVRWPILGEAWGGPGACCAWALVHLHMHMGRRRAACSWLELGVAGRLRIPTQLGGDVHLVGCGGGLLLQQPAVEYRTPRALSSLICDLRTVGRLVDRCENT